MPSTSNFDLTYNQQNVVAGGALSNPAATTGTSTGSGVTKILSGGSNVTLSPTSGVGDVTISVTSGGSGTVTEVKGQGSVNGITLTGDVTTSGYLTLGGTLGSIANTQLSNSTITIAGNSTALGGTVTQDQITGLSATTAGIVKHTTSANTLALATAGTDYSAGTSSLATGIVKSTTSTGALSIAAASDINSTLGTQSANVVYAGPSSGTTPANPAFRSLVNADLPTVAIAHGGTGVTTAPTDGQLLIGNSSTGGYSLATLAGAGTVSVTNGHGTITITGSGGGGTGNVTGTGTSTSGNFAAFNNTSATAINDTGYSSSSFISATATQTPHYVLAGPSTGSSAAPTFRALVPSDVPTLNQNTTGSAGSVTGLSVTSGKTLTASNTLTLAGTDGSTLNVGSGGTLGSAAYTASSSYVAASSGTANNLTLSGTLTASSSTGTSGYYLQSTGSGVQWAAGSGGLPSGSQGQALLYGSSGGAFLNTAINVLTYGTSFSSISSAVSAAQTAGTSLYFPQGSYTISSNLTASCPVIIDGTITINSGVTLTLNGTVTAPLKQVFTVNGTLNIGNTTPNIYPEWFGAKQGSVSDYVAINNALAAVTIDSTTSSMVSQVVLSGNYNIAGQITVTSGKVFKCVWGAQFTASGGYTGDCIVYQHNGQSVVSEIPTIKGFNTGAGLTLLGCSVMDFKCFEINNCKYAVKIKAAVGYPVLDNIIRVQFIADCQYGFYFTSDGTGQTMQGNEMYCNFYTNNNNYSNPWVKTSGGTGTQYTGVSTIGLIAGRYTTITSLGSLTQAQWNTIAGTTGLTYSVGTNFIPAGNLAYDPTITTLGTVTQYAANNIAAGYFDSTNGGAWDGNNLEILAIDLNGATNSYGYYNAASNPINGWLIRCDNWFGGIGGNTDLWANGATYHPGNTARDPSTGNVYALKDSVNYVSTIQPSSDPSHWLAAGTYTSNIFSTSFVTGYFQACTLKFLMRGDLTQPQWGYAWGLYGEYNRVEFRNGGAGSSSPNGQPTLQTSSGSRSSFNPTPIFQNRVVCSYTFPFDFGTNSVATFYAYSVAADGYTSGASNCLNAINLTSLGITIDAIYDNGAVNQNEIVIKARNVSGSVIPTGTQWCIMLVAGV